MITKKTFIIMNFNIRLFHFLIFLNVPLTVEVCTNLVDSNNNSWRLMPISLKSSIFIVRPSRPAHDAICHSKGLARQWHSWPNVLCWRFWRRWQYVKTHYAAGIVFQNFILNVALAGCRIGGGWVGRGGHPSIPYMTTCPGYIEWLNSFPSITTSIS